MDRSIISLVGIIDTIDHLLDQRGSENTATRNVRKRLGKMRTDLIDEGVRHAQTLGRARESIFETLDQLSQRRGDEHDLQWVLHGLVSINIEDVQPPPLPPPSSSGPQAESVAGDGKTPSGQRDDVIQLPLGKLRSRTTGALIRGK